MILFYMIFISVVESTRAANYITVYIPTFTFCACLFVLFVGNVKCTGYKTGVVICEGILCKGTNVVQNFISRIFRFDSKPSFPSHVKVTVSFSMHFSRHLVIVATLTTPAIASHVVSI